MSAATDVTLTEATSGLPALAPAARPPRAYTAVQDAVAIYDTARFEHMQRIATTMARAALTPEHLRGERRGEGNNAVFVPYDPETVIANCFLIVEQADRWHMSPIALASGTSIVRGKLMYEGKVIAAVLQGLLSIDLGYTFGRWDDRNECADVDALQDRDEDDNPIGPVLGWLDVPLEDADAKESLAVRVWDKGDPERYVDGCVRVWRTSGANSPWTASANWRRQLRYRGAREFSRAFEPAILLGVMGDDELDQLLERRDSLAAQAAGAAGGSMRLSAGMGDEAPSPRAPKRQTSPRTAAKGQTSNGAETGGEGPSASAGRAGDGKSSEPGPSTTTAPRDLIDGVTGEVLAEGSAAPYRIIGETTADGRVQIYNPDGSPFRVVAQTEAGAFEARAAAEGEQGRAETNQAASTEGSTVTSSTASGLATVTTSEQTSATVAIGSGPDAGAPTLMEQMLNPFAAFEDSVASVASYIDGKTMLRELTQTDEWKGADPEAKRMARRALWERYAEIYDTGEDKTEPHSDALLMRMWLEFGARSKAEIDAAWPTFWKSAAYKEAGDADKLAVSNLMTERKAALPTTA